MGDKNNAGRDILDMFIVKEDASVEERTFFKDELLPSLPLPSIQQTIEKYLDSCRAVQSNEEYEQTEAVCKDFLDKDALKFHVPLVKKAKVERNWLEDWWLEKAYLEFRKPIMYLYFGGPGPYFESVWPAKKNTQLERSAIMIHITMKFWQLLKDEHFAQNKTASGENLTMHQFRYLFNACRIPKPNQDEMFSCFKTNSEGKSPTHVIVIFRYRFYRIETINPETGKMYEPSDFYKMLSDIKSSAPLEYGTPVAALTSLDRDTWSIAYEHMSKLSQMNRNTLKDIESSLMCFCLEETNTNDITENLRLGVASDCGSKWNDKSFNYLCTLNGLLASCCDHTPYEALVLITFVNFVTADLEKMSGKWSGSWKTDFCEPPVELKFTLDDNLESCIKQGVDEYRKFTDDLDVKLLTFDAFGKKALKPYKVHSDAFIQICLQLAYMRMYGKPAPTYETATTRRFYHGRTETCRTCTPEAVEFCRAKISGAPNALALFRRAHDKFIWLMNECKQNRGCDRHLLGIALTALENGENLPALFNDPGFEKSGGNGNFTISSSLLGYSIGMGAVAPMVSNGYGCFYRINDYKFFCIVSGWNSCQEVSVDEFIGRVRQAMLDVFDMLTNNSTSKL